MTHKEDFTTLLFHLPASVFNMSFYLNLSKIIFLISLRINRHTLNTFIFSGKDLDTITWIKIKLPFVRRRKYSIGCIFFYHFSNYLLPICMSRYSISGNWVCHRSLLEGF